MSRDPLVYSFVLVETVVNLNILRKGTFDRNSFCFNVIGFYWV